MDKLVHRYSAFFPRWCQAFGDHAPDPFGEARAVEWVIGVDSVGVIVLPEVRHWLMHELLAEKHPEVEFRQRSIRLNRRDYDEVEVLATAGYSALRELLLGCDEAHMFLTYHLIYPPGTRIITISSKPPLGLLYREMEPLTVIVGE
ncbi:MAG: hypothetical protein AW08_03422 [Candidatus Accumulibacter adjunctus]|uniref:Uncharacterized protein n=1 Tax=Candidatus Accumulibacter adjunctus TaxID=1454001 RepID=A0A011NL45_9PROT|nr:MAG: hypothetical protein AW08_03422 [Candidatus Accumulibacter adjunctus]